MTSASQRVFMVLVLACATAACAPTQRPQDTTSHAASSATREASAGREPAACAQTLIDIAAGETNTCAVTQDGHVGCWGSNWSRQSAPTNIEDVTGFSVIDSLPPARQVAAGQAYSCALSREHQVYCWGRDRPPARVSPLPKVDSIAIGVDYACAQTRGGSVACWDANTQRPFPVTGTEGSSSLSVGEADACVLDARGQAQCWKPGDSAVSPQAADLKDLRQIATSSFRREIPGTDGHRTLYDWTCAIDSQKQAHCWGSNVQSIAAELGIEATQGPRAIPGLDQVEALSVSKNAVCALKGDGRVACWGSMTGNGNPGFQSTQYALGLQDIVKLSLGGEHACALDTSGRAHCWGDGAQYQLSHSGDRPRAVPGLRSISKVDTGNEFACATATSGEIQCWGRLPWVQDQATALPQKAPLEDRSQLSIGTTNLCGVSPAGEVRCYGSQFDVGNGVISLPQAARDVSVGELHACAVLRDGAVSCWGQGFSGQLGNGSIDDSKRPVAVALPAPVSQVSVGRTHTCAWNEAGSFPDQVWCWGENGQGQIGVGGRQRQLVPVAISLPPVLRVEAGYYATCALLSDRSVQCWGRNTEGQLGLGKIENAETARPVPGLADIANISVGESKTCAVDTKGRLFCWGRVEPYTSEPEQVLLDKAASAVSTSDDQTCVAYRDGGVSCWHRSARESSKMGYGSNAWFPLISCAPPTVTP